MIGKSKYEDMDNDFEDAWMTAGIADLKFDRNDAEKNKKIADKYYKNLKHFFMKETPFRKYERETGRKGIVGTMAT